jgi:hypothetical protein
MSLLQRSDRDYDRRLDTRFTLGWFFVQIHTMMRDWCQLCHLLMTEMASHVAL